ncbi:MAG: hypothetical protein AVDCRST_MAG12-710, partial [uncultured Rubrobacteraceae bacterium]
GPRALHAAGDRDSARQPRRALRLRHRRRGDRRDPGRRPQRRREEPRPARRDGRDNGPLRRTARRGHLRPRPLHDGRAMPDVLRRAPLERHPPGRARNPPRDPQGARAARDRPSLRRGLPAGLLRRVRGHLRRARKRVRRALRGDGPARGRCL